MYRFLRKISLHFERLGEKMSPARYIVLVFLLVILLGSVLLTLPLASKDGQSCSYVKALFTATSASCVTGLALYDTYTQWSGFGQVVILTLIQIGGLGFMTIVSTFFLMMRTKIGLKKRMMIAASFSLDDTQGVVKLVRHILMGTLLVELGGAVILMLRFCADVSFGQALWMGIFHSVSAFCNAGFDILGRFMPNASLAMYVADPTVNFTIMILIVCGGLGFFVWNDLFYSKFRWKKISVYSKMVLVMTAILIFTGAALFCLFEWNNMDGIGSLSPGQKLMASLFQSVTTRTAGFASFDQGKMTDASKAVSVVWMLIGGSSGSTAGGIKTVTVGILALSALQALRGRKYITVFSRTISQEQIINAMTIAVIMAAMSFAGAIVLTCVDHFPFLSSLFETTSALGTVGLSTGITGLTSLPSQIILIVLMFFGRVGIMTIGMGFLLTDKAEERYHYVETKFLIG